MPVSRAVAENANLRLASGDSYRFEDQKWESIVEALGISKTKLTPALRFQLEIIARNFRNRGKLQKYLRNQVERPKARLLTISKAARAILDELGADPAVDKLVSSALSSWEGTRWAALKADLAGLGSVCALLARPAAKAKRTDADRNLAWLRLAQIYKRETGKRPTVSVNVDTSAAEGPFVRFVQTFMDAAGEKVPTGDQIKGVVATHQGKEWLKKNRLTYL
jgi:hypothetical protein